MRSSLRYFLAAAFVAASLAVAGSAYAIPYTKGYVEGIYYSTTPPEVGLSGNGVWAPPMAWELLTRKPCTEAVIEMVENWISYAAPDEPEVILYDTDGDGVMDAAALKE